MSYRERYNDDPQPQYGGPDWAPRPYPAAQPARVVPTSGNATAALILGLVGLVLCFAVIPSALAVAFGHSAIKETRTGERGGHGAAVAGLILGYLVVIPAGLWVVFALIGMIVEAVAPTA